MAKCADCGFLAMRNVETRVLCETEGGFRTTGNHPRMVTVRSNVYEETPICFKDVRDFKEIGVQWPATDAEQRVAALNLDHGCEEWRKWRQGLTPKEHQEMIDRQWMIEREDQRRKDDRSWHIKEALGLVLLAGAFAVIGGYISRSSDSLDIDPLATAVAGLQISTEPSATSVPPTITPIPTPLPTATLGGP